MKLVINYDFFDAIKDINQPLNLVKIVRNNKYKYALFFPYSMSINYLGDYDIKGALIGVSIGYGVLMTMDVITDTIVAKMFDDGTDRYAVKSMPKLVKLVSQLKDINVRTSFSMLLDSELYKKKYKIEFNDSKLPLLKEEKYILVPSYNFNGDEVQTSIMQEHNVGSNNYILSVGEPEKQYRRVLVRNNI